MAKILLSIPDEENKEVKKKAASLGISASAYIRQVLKDSLRKKGNNEETSSLRAIRRLIPVLAEALGRTQKADTQAIKKLSQILLDQYDRGGDA